MRLIHRCFALLVVVALGLMLPAAPYMALASSPVDAFDRLGELTAADAWEAVEPMEGGSDWITTQLQLFEDDVVHEHHHCLLLPLKIALAAPRVMEPDSAHVNELDRPPLRAA